MSTYEISKSSLLSLKAEILKKQQELSKVQSENEIKIKSLKKTAPLDLRNKGVEQRQKNDLTEEEQDLLKKSRDALEVKAKLYDQLAKGSAGLSEEQKEYNRRYLVHFDKKAHKSRVPDLPPEYNECDVDRYPESEDDESYNVPYDAPKNADEEWVEYTDCLGRTRTCLRKDLEYLKSKDRDLEQSSRHNRSPRSRSKSPKGCSPSHEHQNMEPPEISEESELLSGDMRRELLRKQWEKEEEALRDKSNIHYQDILFNEARTHGVGYYGFSKDEDERMKQQDALRKLRKETEEQQKKSQELKVLREKQLAARVKAAMNRKRARMGLPPVEDEPEAAPEPEKPTEEPKATDEKEKILEKLRKSHIRPWDIGKEGVKEHYEYTQEEWVDKKRRERPEEFAPPSAYKREFRSRIRADVEDTEKSLRFSSKKEQKKRSAPMIPVPIVNECEDFDDEQNRLSSGCNFGNERNHRGVEIPLPPTWTDEDIEKSLRFSSRKEQKKRSAPMIEDFDDEQDRLSSDCNFGNESNHRGVEIPPPPTFDYYGPNESKRRREEAATGNISESIDAGLRFLREQMEKKQSRRPRDEDIF